MSLLCAVEYEDALALICGVYPDEDLLKYSYGSVQFDASTVDLMKSLMISATNRERSVGLPSDRSVSGGLPVKPDVVGGSVNLQVLDPVIRAVMIDVVNMLGSEERAAQMLLHDQSMFASTFASKASADVFTCDSSPAKVVAFLRAELGGGGSTLAGAECAAAIDALQGHLRKSLAERRRDELSAPGDSGANTGAEQLLHAGDVGRTSRELVPADFTGSDHLHVLSHTSNKVMLTGPIGVEKSVTTPPALSGKTICPTCGRFLPADSQTCANCAPGTGAPEVSTQGIESTPDETSPTTRPGNLPAPADIGGKKTDDPAVTSPLSGAGAVGVSGKDNAMAAAADRSEDPYGVGVEGEDEQIRAGKEMTTQPVDLSGIPAGSEYSVGVTAIKGTLLCAAELEKFNPNHEPAGSPEGGEFAAAGGYKTGIKLKPTTKRAFKGDPIETKIKLSKIETRDVGEKVAIQYARQYMAGGKNARPLNSVKNNTAVDIAADHKLIEAKAGLVSNSKGAQQWNAKIGEPSKEYRTWAKTASAEDIRAYNDRQRQLILYRKDQLLKRASKAISDGYDPNVITSIINADTRTADVYVFKGYHLRIGWTSDMAKEGFVGSFNY